MSDLPSLPQAPGELPVARLVETCRAIYEARDAIVGSASVEAAIEGLRRAKAIEAYVASRNAKDEARRAARILETAVGAALGPAPGQGARTDITSPRVEKLVKDQDASRFRQMAAHRDVWWPHLERTGMSRADVLAVIKRSAATSNPNAEERPTCTTDDLAALVNCGDRFGTIYADPPWLYDNQATRAATRNHYGGMTVDELCALPVRGLAADDAHLHLWTTNAFLFDCARLFEAWGFEFRSTFVWVKPQMGIGNYWRNSHEILLTGIRGNAKRFNDRTLKSWLECDRSRHSEKPFAIRGMIERASPGPYLEMFARAPADGWTCWGNEIERGLLFPHAEEVA